MIQFSSVDYTGVLVLNDPVLSCNVWRRGTEAGRLAAE